MELNFDAVVRLTEALLPTLRASAPAAIVNVASTAGRVARARTGAYSASKFALAGWTDALYSEERAGGVHVGLVLPGFIATEGFPATELREKALTRWMVSTPERVAEAIVAAGPGGRAERYVPRYYAVAGGAAHGRPRARPPRPLRRRGGVADDEHRRGRDRAPGLLELRSAFRWQYLKPKTKLTLLAALLLRSARIFSWTALTLLPSLSALPTLPRLVLTIFRKPNHFSSRGLSVGGTRNGFDFLHRSCRRWRSRRVTLAAACGELPFVQLSRWRL